MRYLSILTLFVSLSVLAQSEDYQNLALEAKRAGKFDSAIFYFEKAQNTPSNRLLVMELYRQKGDLQKCLDDISDFLKDHPSGDFNIEAKLLKAKVLFSLGELNAAIALSDSILDGTEKPLFTSEAANTKAKSLIWIGEPENAAGVNMLADSIYKQNQLDAPILLGNIFNVHGILSYFNGDFDDAIQNFEKAIETKQEALSNTHPDIISLFGNTGVMYKNKLEYDKALQYYHYELENYAQSIGEDHLYVATSYLNIGGIYMAKAEYDLAIEAYTKALEIRRKKLGEDKALTLDMYEWLGNVYAITGQYDLAESEFLKVLEGRRKIFPEENHFVTLTYYNIAETNFFKENYTKSLYHFRKAAEIGSKIYTANNHDQASNYNGVAMCLDQLGKREEARSTFFQSLEESLPGYEWNGDPTQPPAINNYLRFNEVFHSLLGLARSYEKEGNIESLNTSMNFIKSAKELLEGHKRSFTNKADKITISKSAKELADVAMEVNHKLYSVNGLENYELAMFDWSEYVKGTSLLNNISDKRAKAQSNIPDSVLQVEKRFRFQKDSIKNVLSENETAPSAVSIFSIEKEHEAFISRMEKEYPEYARSKYGLRPSSLEKIMASLEDENHAIVQYYLTQNEDLYISIINKNKHSTFFKEASGLQTAIIDLRSAIEKVDESTFEEVSKELYQLVFSESEDALSNIEKLTIIPDGMLGYIPFELLQNQNGRYLFEDFLIKYDLSSTLLAQKTSKKSDLSNFIAYAPSFFDTKDKIDNQIALVRSDDLGQLPGAKKEAEYLENLLGGKLNAGKLATESSFKSEAEQYDVVHLATHSIINERDPNYTKLLFAKDQSEDGKLHIYELDNLTLNASLVTLSACNTGIGKIAEGEGVMSLARSFRSIGVPSVVMSLWPASDKSTPKLMKYFYKNLKEGQTKDLALNNARKQYLETATGKARHPFYWGGFVLVGDNVAIKKDLDRTKWIFMGLLSALITIILIRRTLKVSST